MRNAQARAILASIRFEKPDFIPVRISVNGACWHHYPQEALFDLKESHPHLFPGFVRPKGHYEPRHKLVAMKDHPYADDFGCLWQTTDDGITGTVTGHPLSDWSAYDTWKRPDPAVCTGIGPIDWEQKKAEIEQRRANGDFIEVGLRHGHTFLQLCDLRGYENLIYDMADEEPKLFRLIEDIETFNMGIIRRYLEIGVDQVDYAEDLGMQVGPMISPAHFLKYIKPSYQRLMKPALDKGVIVHMHSDGDIRDLAHHLIDSGVQVINLQDLVNGIDWIAGKYRGKICVELDVDRQRITRFGTPAQIDALIREEVEKIGMPQGGLMLLYGLYPGTPLENAKAVFDALERYSFYYR